MSPVYGSVSFVSKQSRRIVLDDRQGRLHHPFVVVVERLHVSKGQFTEAAKLSAAATML